MYLLAVLLASFKIEIAGLDFHRRLNIPAALGHRFTESVTDSLTAAYCTVGGASQSRIRIQLSSLTQLLFRCSSLLALGQNINGTPSTRNTSAHPAGPAGIPNRHYVDLSPGTANGVRRTFRALSRNK